MNVRSDYLRSWRVCRRNVSRLALGTRLCLLLDSFEIRRSGDMVMTVGVRNYVHI